MMTLLCLLISQSFAFGPPSVSENNEGVSRYQSEDYLGASKSFNEALGRDPSRPEYHFNLGQTFAQGGEPEKALQEFQWVEKNPQSSNEIKFKSMFNAGNLMVAAKKIDEALAYYQKALEYDPQSKETKTNIELALKQQQGGGGGGGQNDQKQKNQDKDQNQNKDQNDKQDKGDKKDQENQVGQEPKPQKRQFKSPQMTEAEVRQIMEELKRQEEALRAKMDEKKRKRPQENKGKDW
ncbi:MAG: tetratricopeptide repeat protein [Oligoflexia bacterium]|nr:tetratricopeptide repeat protein [Oligoflexia bacterium]